MWKRLVEHMAFVERSGLVSQDNDDTYKEMDGYKLTLAQHDEESATYNYWPKLLSIESLFLVSCINLKNYQS